MHDPHLTEEARDGRDALPAAGVADRPTREELALDDLEHDRHANGARARRRRRVAGWEVRTDA